MVCPDCSAENPDTARFCNRCGRSLTRGCPNCGTPNPLAANFCAHCGEPLTGRPGPDSKLLQYIPKELLVKLDAARAGHSMAGERRVVTILFCDVKGSTAAAEKLDPEDWAEIMNGAFEHLIAPVYRYEGTLARLMGDAVLAFFGAPIAHEDDPERAVLAGLEIVRGIGPYRAEVLERWGIDFNVRVGINTGLVVVGEVGSDLRLEYTAMGDAVNLAARMEQTAQPGMVQISADTHRRVAALFEIEPLGEIEVKGKQHPVPIYRALGRRERPGPRRGIEGLHAPLVGRATEMDRLWAPLGALQRGHGGIIGLLGEAGLGKSRMIEELRVRWTAESPSGYWAESRGVSYETTRPYGQFQQHLLQLCGADPGDEAEHIRAGLAELARRLAPPDEATANQVFQVLLGVEEAQSAVGLEGEELKRALFHALESLLQRQSASRPTVLVFDDLHWADSASTELLAHLFRLTDGGPILFLCAFRSDRQADSWRVKQVAETDYPHRYVEVGLQPLSAGSSQELVERLLPVSELPAELQTLIRDKAEGNPFFVEEVIRTLIDRGAIQREADALRWISGTDLRSIAIPDNLQTLLLSRIDRLEEQARRTLQLAAVVGRTFYYRVLQAVSEAVDQLDRQLGLLQRVELIREAARDPELEYAFRHALTQEAAYGSILRKERRGYHRRVGEALERLFPDRRTELAPLLAHHFIEADDPRGTRYSTEAGDAAYRMYAVAEAIRLYQQALQATDSSDPHLLGHLYTRLGRCYELIDRYDEALRVYAELRSAAAAQSAGELELVALTESAKIHSIPNPMYDPLKGRSLSDQAVELAHRLQNPEAEARILWSRMNSELYEGEVEQAAEFGKRSLLLAEKYELREQSAFTLNDLTRTVLMLGEIRPALEYKQRARALWLELDNLPMLADNYSSGSLLGYWVGDYNEALREGEESYRLAKSIDNLWGQANGLIWVGLAQLELGRLQAAVETLNDGLAAAQAAGSPLAVMFAGSALALTYTEVGNLPGALSAIEQAMALDRGRFPYFWGVPLGMRARLHVRMGELAEARAASQASHANFRPEVVNTADFVLLADAELALAEGRTEQAVAACDELLEAARTANRQAAVPEALLLKARGLRAGGLPEPAREALGQAFQSAEVSHSSRILWQVLLEQSRLEAGAENPQEAAGLRARAGAVVGQLAASLDDPELRRQFEARPEIQEALGR